MAQDILAITGQNEFENLLRLSLDDFDPNQVHFSSSKNDALHQAREFDIALIILDAGSIEDWEALMPALRQIHPECSLILAPPPNEPDHPSIHQLTPDALLSRPFFKDDLIETIEMLAGISPMESTPVVMEPQSADFNSLLSDLQKQLEQQSNAAQPAPKETGDPTLIEEIENLLAKHNELAKQPPPPRQEKLSLPTPQIDDTAKIEGSEISQPPQKENEEVILNNVLSQLKAQTVDFEPYEFENLTDEEETQVVEPEQSPEAELENQPKHTPQAVSPEDESKEIDDLLLQLDRQTKQEIPPETLTPSSEPSSPLVESSLSVEDEKIPPELMQELIESSAATNATWQADIEDWDAFSNEQQAPSDTEASSIADKPEELVEDILPTEPDGTNEEAAQETIIETPAALPAAESTAQPQEEDILLAKLEQLLAEPTAQAEEPEADATNGETPTVVSSAESTAQPAEVDALLAELEQLLAEPVLQPEIEELTDETPAVPAAESTAQPQEEDALLAELEQLLGEPSRQPEVKERIDGTPAVPIVDSTTQPEEVDALLAELEQLPEEPAVQLPQPEPAAEESIDETPAMPVAENVAQLETEGALRMDTIARQTEAVPVEPESLSFVEESITQPDEDLSEMEEENPAKAEAIDIGVEKLTTEPVDAIQEIASTEPVLEPAETLLAAKETAPSFEATAPAPDFLPQLKQALAKGHHQRAAESLSGLAGYHSIPALLIAYQRKVWAASEQVKEQDAAEIEAVLNQSGPEKEKVDMARFIRLGSNHEKYLLYAATITGALTLCTINETTKPLSQIRSQTIRLANEMEVDSYIIPSTVAATVADQEQTVTQMAAPETLPAIETAQPVELQPDEIIEEPLTTVEPAEPQQTTVDALLAEAVPDEAKIEEETAAPQSAEEWVHELSTEEQTPDETTTIPGAEEIEPISETTIPEKEDAFEIPFEELENILPGEAEEIIIPGIIEATQISTPADEPDMEEIEEGEIHPEIVVAEDEIVEEWENTPVELPMDADHEPIEFEESLGIDDQEAKETALEPAFEIESVEPAEAGEPLNEVIEQADETSQPGMDETISETPIPVLAAHILPKAGYGRIRNRKKGWEKIFLTSDAEFIQQQKQQFSHKQPAVGVELTKPDTIPPVVQSLLEPDWQPTQTDILSDIRHKLKNQKKPPQKWIKTSSEIAPVFELETSCKEDLPAIVEEQEKDDAVQPDEVAVLEEVAEFVDEAPEQIEEDTQPVEIFVQEQADETDVQSVGATSTDTPPEEILAPPETLLETSEEPEQAVETSPEEYQEELDEILQDIIVGLDEQQVSTDVSSAPAEADQAEVTLTDTVEPVAAGSTSTNHPLKDEVEVVILDEDLDLIKELAAEMDFEKQFAIQSDKTGLTAKQSHVEPAEELEQPQPVDLEVPETMPEPAEAELEEPEPTQIEPAEQLEQPQPVDLDVPETMPEPAEAELEEPEPTQIEPAEQLEQPQPVDLDVPETLPKPAEAESFPVEMWESEIINEEAPQAADAEVTTDESETGLPGSDFDDEVEEFDHGDFVRQVRERLSTMPEPEEKIAPPDIDEEFSWSVIALQQSQQTEQSEELPDELETNLKANEIAQAEEIAEGDKIPKVDEIARVELEEEFISGIEPEVLSEIETLTSEDTAPLHQTEKIPLYEENFEVFPTFDEWEREEILAVEEESTESEVDLDQIVAEVLAEQKEVEEPAGEQDALQEEIPLLKEEGTVETEEPITVDQPAEALESAKTDFQTVLSAQMENQGEEVLDADLLPWEKEPVPAPETIEVTPTPRALMEEENAADGLIDILGESSLNPVNLSFDQPMYTCILVPELSEFSLNNRIATRIKEWLPRLSRVFGWQIENILVQPTYLQWTVRVPSGTSQGSIVRRVRQQTSLRIFEEFPDLMKLSHSGNFWAKGYLVVSGGSPPPAEFLDDFIQKNRRPKGILGS